MLCFEWFYYIKIFQNGITFEKIGVRTVFFV